MVKGLVILFLLLPFSFIGKMEKDPRPSVRQVEWQAMETTAFLHFSINTFTDREWGDGTEDPKLFNPVHFNADSIVAALKDAGFKMAIITAKHHDGFCLWPSKFTKHSVASSAWKNGKGDVIRDLSEACKKYGLKLGIYLSPWDRHESSYGTPAYNEFYKNQLKELLTGYGDISEVWFDGAKGENAKDMQYDFAGYWKIVRELQPKAVIFSDVGPDVRWVGNEAGNAGETCWSTINTNGMAPGKANENYLNTGDPDGRQWIPAETDVSIRPGWFYHPSEDSLVKSPQQLVDLYYRSVGRNSLLLLNIPPNREGLLSKADMASIREFRRRLDATFRNNLLEGSTFTKLTDKDLNTFHVLNPNESMVIRLKKEISFNRIMLQENIAEGQRNEAAQVDIWDGKDWKLLTSFTTIGYKRLLRFATVQTRMIRLTVVKAKRQVQVAEMGCYLEEDK